MTHPIGQHFLAGFDGFSVTDDVRELILKEKILGFTLFKWNIESAAQLKALNDELKALAREAGYELILAVDQEGGRVQRLPAPFTKIPAMRHWSEACSRSGATGTIYELGRVLGCEVRLAGFNMDFAPVVDVDTNAQNPIIGDRAFSSDAGVVAKHARELIRGLVREGVIPCLKHFPGHGATLKDSHLELPVDERSWAELLALDVVPYLSLIAESLAPAVMTAHVLYPKIDADNPATLSRRIVGELLRGDLGYDGVVFSDDFTMKAIADNHELGRAARTFFEIGGDVVLVCKHPEWSLDIIRRLKSESAANDAADLKEGLRRAACRVENLKRQFFPSFHGGGDLAAVTEKNRAFVNGIFPANPSACRS